MATYVGYTTAGIPGAIVASLGEITPCIIVILIVSRILKAFRENEYVDAAFYGLKPCSVALIAAAGVLVLKISLFNFDLFAQTGSFADIFNIKAILLAAVLIVLTRCVKFTKKLHPVCFIALSAVAGILLGF